MKHDHFDFNETWAASIDEAAFVSAMIAPVRDNYIWARRTDEENEVIV